MNSGEHTSGGGLSAGHEDFQNDIIMMIDDEPLMLGILEVYLVQAGYRNFIALDDSTKAVELIKAEKPDCVFLDIHMPEVNGFEILQTLRADPETRQLSVIVLTSDTDPATKLKALEMGVTDFLEKPVDSSELVLRLRNALIAKAYRDQLTYYDGLTRLPNRLLFQQRLEAGVIGAQRNGKGLALMIVSVDRFQNVNDSLGPTAGDAVLIQISQRLAELTRDAGYNKRKGPEGTARCLARLGGDEFAISLPGVTSEEQIAQIGEQISEVMKKPFEVEGEEVVLTASLGIARYPEDSIEASQLLKHAGAAKEAAKKEGRNTLQYYTSEFTERADERRSLEADLHKALAGHQLRLHFQPQLNISSGQVVGMEALVRWRHPKRGLVQPDQFIPLAEQNDLIIAIDAWVIEEACRQTRAWHLAGYEGLQVSVNVSARQFKQPDLAGQIAAACQRAELPPSSLTVELTESLVMGNLDKTARLLHDLKDIGVTVSVDDFGTGYSSLAYLKRFPIDELKIDRSFIGGVPGDLEDSAIVRAIVAMARSLELEIVAEGVETGEQYEFLRGLECDRAQGLLMAAPLRDSEFFSFLAKNWNQFG
ncbi:MAG: EAL domain-containing protein [Halieaceae bacterium]|jgi:diguanylate cyclase (GGDEF)-like protein|nr:EAL domain-containing protein [Halieaceae bacterium]